MEAGWCLGLWRRGAPALLRELRSLAMTERSMLLGSPRYLYGSELRLCVPGTRRAVGF